jgi:thioesterase DpgC
MESIYGVLTDGFRRQLRISELVYAAAEQFPEHLPSRTAIAAERELLQKHKQGLEINQGIFVAHVLADPRAGFHLIHAMSQPTAQALALLEGFQRDGSADLGPMRVDREGDVGHVTVQNHAFLNSEDDVSTAALEVAIDLVLLDDSIRVGASSARASTSPTSTRAGSRSSSSCSSASSARSRRCTADTIWRRSTPTCSSAAARSPGSRQSTASRSAGPASGCS